MQLTFDYDPAGITLRGSQKSKLATLFSRPASNDLRYLPANERALICAIADLRAISGDDDRELRISEANIWLSHRAAANLDAGSAKALGLPTHVDLTFVTDVEGVVGSPGFRLVYNWTRAGQRRLPSRVGAILETDRGPRLIPHWMLDAIEIADASQRDKGEESEWEALARFRQALEPGLQLERGDTAARMSMTDFLSGLEVRIADAFSISPTGDGTDFEVVPFSNERLAAAGGERDGEIDEGSGELAGEELRAFQRRLRDRGALPAYRVRPGSYLIVDGSSMPALRVMARKQHAPREERGAFIANPRPALTEAVMADLEARGMLNGLDAAGLEESVEAIAGPVLVETAQYSNRVLGIKLFAKDVAPPTSDSTTWMPEDFARKLSEYLDTQSQASLKDLQRDVETAIEVGDANVVRENLDIPARPETLKTISARLDRMAPLEGGEKAAPLEERGPVVLESKSNLKELQWFADLKPRSLLNPALPKLVRTPLKPHQVQSFEWQQAAWKAGLPGVINADEQGLGKTLQTLTFLSWLQSEMTSPLQRRPLLVVAPTSLLLNWEQEVERHLEAPGLGHVIRLYGAGIGARKQFGVHGRDIDGGSAKLDLEFLHEAIVEGRAHRFWVLTTYTTLTNYQHSLAKIPFAAAVFDEIQTLKNSRSMRSEAARAIKADFTIGLTGTPIENSALDLWAVMDQVAPGRLDTEETFRSAYGVPDAGNMADLHSRVFKPHGEVPSVGIRRLKSEVASDLPSKRRRLYPRAMPPEQELAYEDARLKLAQGGFGAALKMLHHIRAVSVHPNLEARGDDQDFVRVSARLSACFELIRKIQESDERALVFIEHRRMQYRFIELVKAEFGLANIDLISGDTPIKTRQEIVNRFQQYGTEPGFDLLVLGPKAAGTGLTLTSATHVIHLSRWWNPAVEEQCNDRVHRIGQTRDVTVHLPMAVHKGYREQSFDCLLHSLMQKKRKLAESALWPMGDTSADADQLQSILSNSASDLSSGNDPVKEAITAMFARDGLQVPVWSSDGFVTLDPPDDI